MVVADGDETQAAEKFFDPTIFQKCWRGSGRAAHICGANEILQSLASLLQLHFLKLPNSELGAFMKQVANSDRATGQLQHAGRQKQGWNPLLPDAENRFS